MDVIRTQFRLDNLYSLALTQGPDYLAYLRFVATVDYLAAILRRKNYVIFTIPTRMCQGSLVHLFPPVS